jgi:hypothetical protein
MSIENITLLAVAAILCLLNLGFGPLAEKIANFFARISRDPSPAPDASGRYVRANRAGQATGPANRERAERQSPPGPDDAPPASRTTRTSRAIGDAQMSKYR